MASSRGQPDCWKLYASYPGKVKLNRDCWIFYQEGYVNIHRNREVRADRYEDISALPSFEANCADEIYAGHVAEHVDDVKASFGRWFEVLVAPPRRWAGNSRSKVTNRSTAND